MTGGKDGIIMLWHLSKDVNDHATLSNRPYQLLRGHTSKITSGSINKTYQTAVTVSIERLALIPRIEEAPPNDSMSCLRSTNHRDKFEQHFLASRFLQTKINDCIVTAAGVIVCVVD